MYSFNTASPVDAKSLRHSKEVTYYTIMLIVSLIAWIPLFLIALIYVIPIALILWISGLYFRAMILGDSIRVSRNQFPEIYAIAEAHSSRLGLQSVPEMFVYNSNGFVNAFAVRFLSKQYVILMSELVDLMLANGSEGKQELSMIIGHELAHHAVGHTNTWKNFLLLPGSYIPFLGNAYSRACELTADRIGFVLTNDVHTAQNALVRLALGSKMLSNQVDIDTFVQQERDIPEFMGFIYKLYSSHPRMTVRVNEIGYYSRTGN